MRPSAIAICLVLLLAGSGLAAAKTVTDLANFEVPRANPANRIACKGQSFLARFHNPFENKRMTGPQLLRKLAGAFECAFLNRDLSLLDRFIATVDEHLRNDSEVIAGLIIDKHAKVGASLKMIEQQRREYEEQLDELAEQEAAYSDQVEVAETIFLLQTQQLSLEELETRLVDTAGKIADLEQIMAGRKELYKLYKDIIDRKYQLYLERTTKMKSIKAVREDVRRYFATQDAKEAMVRFEADTAFFSSEQLLDFHTRVIDLVQENHPQDLLADPENVPSDVQAIIDRARGKR